MLNRIITYSFYTLFFLTPLFWTSLNFELFEYNKMILTYGLTVVIVGAWILKMVNRKSFIVYRTPLDIPFLLFLGANILSSIFSIDQHASIWGYYSRSNGGLLSIISYLLLYWAFVSNMDLPKVLNTLKFGLASGFIISLWGIAEHFGVSPSCVILRGEFNASCWVQDVQARVFATLGQPNWMAAYLVMLIFPALYFFLTSKTKVQLVTCYLLLVTFYLAFTFTYSRGPTLGLIGGIFVFIVLYVIRHPERSEGSSNLGRFLVSLGMTKMGGVLVTFLFINLLFGSALTSFRLVSKFAPPPRPSISLPAPSTTVTQLEQGGTESGQIRLIVWKGALDIFRNYPIFGSGVETFAYSYYQFRPAEHNFTTEWDFLYNKAHNEYLNYLATTGLVGFGAYILMIGTFLVWSIRFIVNRLSIIGKQKNDIRYTIYDILVPSILASYISYLVYNFFLFSVVAIAQLFYLFPALILVATESVKTFKWPKRLYPIPYTLYPILYRRPLYTKTAKGLVILSTFYLLYSIFQLWYADTLFSRGQRASEAGNPGRAYNLLSIASSLNRGEPFYRSELAFSAAQAAVVLAESDTTLSAQLKDEAVFEMEKVLRESSKNVSFWRTAIRTYFELSSLDGSFTDKTLEALDRAIQLAPTDPKLYYNKALVLLSEDKNEEAIKSLQKAIELKPSYLEARQQLEEATGSSKDTRQQ